MNGGLEYGRRVRVHSGFTAHVRIAAFLNSAGAEQSLSNDCDFEKFKQGEGKRKKKSCIKKNTNKIYIYIF